MERKKRNHLNAFTRQHGKTEKEYLEFCGLTIGDDFEKIKNKLLWCTRGKDGKSPAYWVKLADCDTNHLENIITEMKYVHPITKKVIISIIKDRWKKDKLAIADIKLKLERWKEEGYSVDEIDKVLKSVGYE